MVQVDGAVVGQIRGDGPDPAGALVDVDDSPSPLANAPVVTFKVEFQVLSTVSRLMVPTFVIPVAEVNLALPPALDPRIRRVWTPLTFPRVTLLTDLAPIRVTV